MAIAHERRVGNLPATLTSFVGRKQEITDIRVLLTGTTRLVTLTGAGGVGKTRLAIEAAARLQQARVFDDGVWLVELAALSDPRVLAQTVAAVFQLQEEPERDFVSVLIDALSARYMLLILDNCEHLVDACATFAHSILRSCPRVSILATSREPLGIDGETTRRVPSLPRPDPARLPPIEQVRDFPAVRLFADRGAAVMRDFSITQHNAASVAHVCDRLDGIPLALELAAARIRALSVEQIVERLDDRFRLLTGGSRAAPARQQTLEAAVAWSYDLLQEDERHLLRRLAVFAGGWTLDDAESVCADHASILEPLTRLVEKSLVLAEDGPNGTRWYRLLETIRQFALERLRTTGEESATVSGISDGAWNWPRWPTRRCAGGMAWRGRHGWAGSSGLCGSIRISAWRGSGQSRATHLASKAGFAWQLPCTGSSIPPVTCRMPASGSPRCSRVTAIASRRERVPAP